MPLEVTIALVPNGDTSRRETLHQLKITQVHAYDDNPNGKRRYRVDGPWGTSFEMDHYRGDGAMALVRGVLRDTRVSRLGPVPSSDPGRDAQ